MTRIPAFPISAVWSGLSATARFAAGKGWLQSRSLDSRVISVGNLQAGGAGKTPLVAQIAREAQERGLRACILSRGYGSAWEGPGGIIAPGGEPADAAQCGDEPALLHDLAPEAFIGIGADRVAQYEKVRERLGRAPDLVILDDGFQHWKIRKDLEVVAVTSASRFELPFRDAHQALRHADLVVWTKGEERPPTEGRPLVKVRFSLPAPPDDRPVWLVTGLANGGTEARRSIEAAGYRVERHLSFPDHARYEVSVAQGLVEDASRSGQILALTGKDWVKWRGLGISRARVVILEPQLVFEEGREQWNQMLWGESS